MFGNYVYAQNSCKLWPNNTFLFDWMVWNRLDEIPGRNALHGSIPGFFVFHNKTSNPDCSGLLGPIKKLGLTWLTQEVRVDVDPLIELRSLSLCKYESWSLILVCFEVSHFLDILVYTMLMVCYYWLVFTVVYCQWCFTVNTWFSDQNRLSGTIPGELGDLSNLADLSLGKWHQNSIFAGDILCCTVFVGIMSLLIQILYSCFCTIWFAFSGE